METLKEKIESKTILPRITEILYHIPLKKQIEILDFAEFIFYKHLDDIQSGKFKEKEEGFQITEELKSFLKARQKEHRENREAAKEWDVLETDLLKRYES